MILFNNFISPADSSKILYLTKYAARGGPKNYDRIIYFFTPTNSLGGLDLPASYADARG